jgi:hypothetical protein
LARCRLLTIVLVLVGLVGVFGSPAAATLPDAPLAAAAAAGPIQFGAAQAAAGGASKIEAIQALEAVAGRQLAVMRVYDSWDSAFPDATATWLKTTGHTMFLSIKTKRNNGKAVRWADIAAAKQGDALYADMVRWADAIKAYGVPLYLSFNHEPETSVSHPSGAPAEYVLAWRAFVDLFRDRGVDNAHFAWTTAVRNYSAPQSSAKYAPRFYPGDDWVDFLAIDAYNMYCLTKNGTFSRPWRSLEELLAPFMLFAAGHPDPGLLVAEFGTPEDPANPQRKADWILQARQLFQQQAYTRFRAVSYWNQLSHNFAGCDFRVTSSAAARNAFTAMAKDPYYSAP